MIIRPDFPSYGNWIKNGATTLHEGFLANRVDSLNHHFWGDISGWFVKCLSGIQFNPTGDDMNKVDITPAFVEALDYAEGYYTAPAGKILSSWRKEGGHILLTLQISTNVNTTVYLESGYAFEDATSMKTVCSGEYVIVRRN